MAVRNIVSPSRVIHQYLSGETGDHASIETMSRAVIKSIEDHLEMLLFRRPTILKAKVTGCAEYVDPRGNWYPQPASIMTLEKWNESSNAWVRQTPIPPLNYNDELLLDVGVWRLTLMQGLVAQGETLPLEIKWAIQRFAAYLRDKRPMDGTRTSLIVLSGADELLEPWKMKQARALRMN